AYERVGREVGRRATRGTRGEAGGEEAVRRQPVLFFIRHRAREAEAIAVGRAERAALDEVARGPPPEAGEPRRQRRRLGHADGQRHAEGGADEELQPGADVYEPEHRWLGLPRVPPPEPLREERRVVGPVEEYVFGLGHGGAQAAIVRSTKSCIAPTRSASSESGATRPTRQAVLRSMPPAMRRAVATSSRVLGTSARPRSRRVRSRAPSVTMPWAVARSTPLSCRTISISRSGGGKSNASATKRWRVLGLRSFRTCW